MRWANEVFMTDLQVHCDILERQLDMLTTSHSMRVLLDRITVLEEIIKELTEENSKPIARALCREWGFTGNETRLFLALHRPGSAQATRRSFPHGLVNC